MALEDLLAQLSHPALPIISPGLERVETLLGALGNPERRLPPVVHVAGTNGKGSLIAYLRAAFEAAGLRAHVYSSPHLVRFNERIRLGGTLIGDKALERLLLRVAAAAENVPTTFFEATTAAAFLAFSESPADVVLLETGLGGRLDATNVIQRPLLTAITPISHDHAEYLGDTLEAIAFEKAGILKRGVPCISAPQTAAVRGVLCGQAKQKSAPMQMGGKQWHWWAEEDKLCFRAEDMKQPITFPKPNLEGAHQWPNAMLAVAVLRELMPHFALSEAHIARGLTQAQWPARLQKLPSLHPIRQALPLGSQAWLDGGHNEAAANAIADWMQDGKGRFWLIWGMLRSKDAAAFLRPLAPLLEGVIAVPVLSEFGAYAPEHLAEIARKAGVTMAETAPGALRAAQCIDALSPEKPVRILIAGSLYLAGEVLKLGGAPD